jgi:nitrate reductase assembly molybdenum cofactor insertion protein NarJ
MSAATPYTNPATTRDFTLAALSLAWPDEELVQVVSALGEALQDHVGLGPLAVRLQAGLEGLQGDYLAAVDVGPRRVPLYETEYGRMRALSKGRDLADVLGFYNAFGLDLTEGAAELPDHVAIELEFYALLSHKQLLLADDPVGTEIVLDARRKFLIDHLGGFVPTLARAVSPEVSAPYGAALAWVDELVAAECRALGVTPAPLDFLAAEEDGVACGGCVGIPGLEQPQPGRARGGQVS